MTWTSDRLWKPWDLSEGNLLQQVEDAIERGLVQGLSQDEAERKVLEAFQEGLDELVDASGQRMAETLRSNAPAMLARERWRQRSFERRLRWVWGDALDLLQEVIVCAHELGAGFQLAFGNVADEEDHRFEVLVSLHARACLVSMEILTLLRSGYPLGATARWRTLHEITVVAAVIGDGDQDLALRYRRHANAEAYEDALLWQHHRPEGTRSTLEPEELAELKVLHDEALADYGPKFAEPWRWAEPANGGRVPSFYRLEQIAGLGHLRPNTREASHLVHAGARGTEFGLYERRGRLIRSTGPVNVRLAEPGHGAAISLVTTPR